MDENKILELSEKTVRLLEKTKKNSKLYEKERQQLYYYFVTQNNLTDWENYIKEFEEKLNKM